MTNRKIIYLLAFIFVLIGIPHHRMIAAISERETSAIPSEKNHEVFMGMIIKNNEQLIPMFLKSIDRLDYEKKLLTIQINDCTKTAQSKEILADWIKKNKDQYHDLIYIDNHFAASSSTFNLERINLFRKIKNDYLTTAKELGCDHCFIIESDAFIAPVTLKQLISKNKPIIAPLLRPIPESYDSFRNFFADATDSGYYKDHPDYIPISNRQKIGTFKVPCVQAVYLIQSQYLDQLSFASDLSEWEFLNFARIAKNNNVDQYICNEKEFGSFLHFKKELTEEEEQAFTLIEQDLEVTPGLLNSVFCPYYSEDPQLREYVNNFDYDKYAIYRVENSKIFYVDDIYDWVKSLYIKNGNNWEESIHEEFKKYVKPGSVAIDIGGHMGTHTLNLSKLVGDSGSVHTFEPQVKMFCELNINMHLNKCKNIVFHRRALGNEERIVEMYLPCATNEGMACVNKKAKDPSGDTVKMVKLDSFNLNNVSFIKIDVEGYERDVIQGAKATILRNKPVMIIEIFQGPEFLTKIKEIEDLGYQHALLAEHDYVFLPKDPGQE